DTPAGQSLADVVIRPPLQLERDPARQERAEALSPNTFECAVYRVLRQAFVAVPARDRTGEHRSDGTIGVANAIVEPHGLLRVQGGLRVRDQAMIQRPGQAMVL